MDFILKPIQEHLAGSNLIKNLFPDHTEGAQPQQQSISMFAISKPQLRLISSPA